MKELYLAMDRDGTIWGHIKHPVPDKDGDWWSFGYEVFDKSRLLDFGIDVTKFPITHETPIKIRAVWEVCDEN